MTTSHAPGHYWTFEDLLTLPDDGNRYEIFDGSLLVTPPPLVAHAVSQGALTRLLMFAAPDDLLVLDGGAGVSVRDGTFYIPDLVVLDANAVGQRKHTLQPADVRLAVEVLSPSTRGRDLVLKRHEYAAAGIPDYWIVDREQRRLTVLSLDPSEGKYREETVVEAGTQWRATRPFEVTLDPGDFC
jgi:Uma2 family endonuclease